MESWYEEFSEDWSEIEPLLHRSQDIAGAYPCPSPGGDGCPRRIISEANGKYLAICGERPQRCESVSLTLLEIEILKLRLGEVTTCIAIALGAKPISPVPHGLDLFRIGQLARNPADHVQVFLSVAETEVGVHSQAAKLIIELKGSFLLLVALEDILRPETREAISNSGGTCLALESVLSWDRGLAVETLMPIGPLLDREKRIDVKVNRIEKRGRSWYISFNGLEFDAGRLNGFGYLKVLVENQGEEHSLEELARKAGDSETPAAESNKIAGNEGLDGRISNLDPQLDEAGRKKLNSRLADLERQISTAKETDRQEVEKFTREKSEIEATLRKSRGLRNRDRVTGDPLLRERERVRKAIDRALKELAKACPPLHDHLKIALVKTGEIYSYKQQEGILWSAERPARDRPR